MPLGPWQATQAGRLRSGLRRPGCAALLCCPGGHGAAPCAGSPPGGSLYGNGWLPGLSAVASTGDDIDHEIADRGQALQLARQLLGQVGLTVPQQRLGCSTPWWRVHPRQAVIWGTSCCQYLLHTARQSQGCWYRGTMSENRVLNRQRLLSDNDNGVINGMKPITTIHDQ